MFMFKYTKVLLSHDIPKEHFINHAALRSGHLIILNSHPLQRPYLLPSDPLTVPLITNF